MNDKTARNKLKDIQKTYSSYRNSRRARQDQHETLNKALHEFESLKLKAANNK